MPAPFFAAHLHLSTSLPTMASFAKDIKQPNIPMQLCDEPAFSVKYV
jgi:hypothetical protein